MPRKHLKPPTYRHHKGRDLAAVTLTDAATGKRRNVYLGEFDSVESREWYHRLIAEWEANGRRIAGLTELTPPAKRRRRVGGITLNRLVDAYWRQAKTYYTSSEAGNIKASLKVAREMFGSEPAEALGPNKLRRVREAMITRGLTRDSINRRVDRIRAMYRWAASHELMDIVPYQRLKAVESLRLGKSRAVEGKKVRPVADERVDAVLPQLSSPVAALVKLQRLTGARPGELFKLRPIDLDTSGDVWVHRPEKHKTAHKGKERIILFGPRAQAVIAPFLSDRPVDKPLFSPAEAEAEYRAKRTAERKTPPGYGNRPGTNRREEPERRPSDRYDANSYRRAVQRACDRLFTPPEHLARIHVEGRRGMRCETPQEHKKRLGPKKWAELQRLRKENRWTPYQIRHTVATEIRKSHGVDLANTILGHGRGSAVTEVYAEQDFQKAERVIASVG